MGFKYCWIQLHYIEYITFDPHEVVEESIDNTPEISDKAFEIGAINSNKFRPQDFAHCEVVVAHEQPVFQIQGKDMVNE